MRAIKSLLYNNPLFIKQRHDIKSGDAVFDKICNVLELLSKAATTPNQ